MIQVHHLNNSRSQRVLWLLEELGVEYEIESYARDPRTKLAPDSLRKIHPLGKSPVITDGDHTLAESGAVVEYLIEEYGAHFRPSDRSMYLRFRYWLHYAEGSAMTPFLLKLVFGELARQAPFLARPLMKAIGAGVSKQYIDREIVKHVRYWDAELADTEWFAGEFSGADVMMSFPAEAAEFVLGDVFADYPNVRDFLARVRARDAYQRGLERGGPYSIA